MEDRTKFNIDRDTEKRSHDGIVFDSVMEMNYYRDIVLPQMRSGNIKHYELQKEYTLQPKFIHNGETIRPIMYVADFYIEYADGSVEVIDVKGFADSQARMKRKMFWYVFPDIPYRWVCNSKLDGGWCDYNEVQRNRKERKRVKRIKGDQNG